MSNEDTTRGAGVGVYRMSSHSGSQSYPTRYGTIVCWGVRTPELYCFRVERLRSIGYSQTRRGVLVSPRVPLPLR